MATASALALMSSVGLVLVRSRLALWPFDRRLLKGFLAALVASGVLYTVQATTPPQSVLGLLVVLALDVAVFTSALTMLGLEPEERSLLSDALGRFTRPE